MQSPPSASSTEHISLRGALLSVLLVLMTLPENAASQQCPDQSSCIRPQPIPPPHALGEADLNAALIALRCEMVCIKEYAPDAELINENSPWPTYADFDFSDNCGLYNKIQGCKRGCMEHFAIPDLTVNRCRENCFDQCRNSTTTGNGECPKDCRKTYCRFGCLLYESFSNDNASILPQTALARPEVVSLQTTNTCTRWHREVMIGLPASQNESSLLATQQQQPVTFLLKVSSQDDSFVRYIWQKTLNMSLNLAPLACQQISLSYAVVSKSTSLSSLVFSPGATVCIPGLAAYPSQVDQDSIQVKFSEDTREGFFGYSVANLSWQRRPDHDCVSSYQVNVYPDREECGGIAEREQPGIKFLNIDRTFTSFVFRAKEANGFMKFGCSYIFEVETLPVPRIQIGPRITRLTQLASTPSMKVECKRVWGKDGHFNVSVSVTLPASEPSSHITQFTFSPTLKRNGQSIQTLKQGTLVPQGNSNEFVKVLSTPFIPKKDNSHTVNVQINAEKDRAYFWRTVPQAKQCSVSMDPIPPESIKDILVENILYTSSSRRLLFDISWTAPVAYGQLKDYDLVVLDNDDRDRLLSGTSVNNLEPYHRQTLTPGLSTITINASVQVNSSTHCLYLKMRARNNYTLYSDWSSAVVLPLDGHCIVQPPTSPLPDSLSNVTSIPIDREDDLPNSKISVFYEADDGSRVRLLDVGCEANPGSSEQNIHNRLQGIESRVDAVLSQLNAEHEAFERLSHLQAKLNNIEQKLDALMSLVTTHVYGHDT